MRWRVLKVVIDDTAVQSMTNPGIEVMVGVTRDRRFGLVIMFGLGGIFVEAPNTSVYRDGGY